MTEHQKGSGEAATGPGPGGTHGKAPHWAGDEMGELLAQPWEEAPAARSIAEEWDAPAAWEVDPIPSAAEGGVLALFATGSRPFRPVPPPWAVGTGDGAEHADRNRLVDMLDNLPGPLPRVSASDITVDGVAVPPVTLWWWGDDDIYPGRIAAMGASGGASPAPRVLRRRPWSRRASPL
jgi:hypothetical protein